MARKYSRGASKEVKNEMHRYKRGTAKSGKGGRVKSRKQAICGVSKDIADDLPSAGFCFFDMGQC